MGIDGVENKETGLLCRLCRRHLLIVELTFEMATVNNNSIKFMDAGK